MTTRRPGRELGWPVTKQLSHHLAMLTEPSFVTEAVLELLGGSPALRP